METLKYNMFLSEGKTSTIDFLFFSKSKIKWIVLFMFNTCHYLIINDPEIPSI